MACNGSDRRQWRKQESCGWGRGQQDASASEADAGGHNPYFVSEEKAAVILLYYAEQFCYQFAIKLKKRGHPDRCIV